MSSSSHTNPMREWTIYNCPIKTNNVVVGHRLDGRCPQCTEVHHVVEKSAYDTLKQTVDYAAELADRQLTAIADSMKERDLALAELEGVKKACASCREKYVALTAEINVLKTENANKCEELAEALGEVGIDVSNTYDFTDLVQQISCLVHEVEVEKVEIERDRLKSANEKLRDALGLARAHAFDYITHMISPKYFGSKAHKIFTETVEVAERALEQGE